jgi:hypothetical protein
MPVIALRRRTFNGVEPTFMQNRHYEDRLKNIYKNMIFVMFRVRHVLNCSVKKTIKV